MTSAGSYSMSASWMTAISFVMRVAASRTAEPLPRLGWRSSTTSGWPSAHVCTIAAVASVEPSSTTMISTSRCSAVMRSSTSRMVAASLYAGMRKETPIVAFNLDSPILARSAAGGRAGVE